MSSLLLVGIAAAHSHHGLEDILRREGLLRPVGSHGARELAVCGLVNALDREMRRGRELRSGGMSVKVVAPLNGPSGSGCSVARSDLVLLWVSVVALVWPAKWLNRRQGVNAFRI